MSEQMNSSSINQDPNARHDRVLEDLDRQIEIARAADKSQWMAEVAHTAPIRMRSEDDARYLVQVTPGSVLPYLRGRRNILQRHEPVLDRCARCGSTFPCPDWRDAAGEETT